MTLRRWMKRFGLKMVVVATNRRRVYIADDAMAILIDHIHDNVIKNDDKTKNRDKMSKINREYRQVIMIGKVKYYSLVHTASLLGVSVGSVKRWIRQDKVEKKRITIDARRVYIAREDVLRMAELHMCKVPSQVYEDTDIQTDVNTMKHDMDELCTIKEVALYLDI